MLPYVPDPDPPEEGKPSDHWEQVYRSATEPGASGLDYFGLTNELMVGYFGPGFNPVLSSLSIATLVDFGYHEVQPGSSEGNPNVASGIGMLSKCSFRLNCRHHGDIKIINLSVDTM